MKIIKKLSEYIEEEIDGAEAYIKDALKYREEYPTLAKVLYDISLAEMEHINLLHGEVVKLIESYRKEHGEPPASMKAIYDYLHEKQIEKVYKVKVYQEQYKNSR